MNENFHERHEGVTLAAGGLFHDMVLLVLSQSSAAWTTCSLPCGFPIERLYSSGTASPVPIRARDPTTYLCQVETKTAVLTNVKLATPTESKCSHTESK